MNDPHSTVESMLRRRMCEQADKIAELEAILEAAEDKACAAMAMVPMYVFLPHEVYQSLRKRAEEQGQPAAELASLWLWRAVREW